MQGLYLDDSRIVCPQNEYTDLPGQAPFIPLCSSASEFLLAQKGGTLCMYLIYLITLSVPAQVLPLNYVTVCNHKVSLSMLANLVMKEGEISSLTDSCRYR